MYTYTYTETKYALSGREQWPGRGRAKICVCVCVCVLAMGSGECTLSIYIEHGQGVLKLSYAERPKCLYNAYCPAKQCQYVEELLKL